MNILYGSRLNSRLDKHHIEVHRKNKSPKARTNFFILRGRNLTMFNISPKSLNRKGLL